MTLDVVDSDRYEGAWDRWHEMVTRCRDWLPEGFDPEEERERIAEEERAVFRDKEGPA